MLILIMMMLPASVLSGCKTNKEKYGEEIFVCRSDNFMGFAGAYIDDENRMTLVFDKLHTMKGGNSHPGLKQLFNNGAYLENETLTVRIKSTTVLIYDDKITVDKHNMTISFVIEPDVKPEEITGFFIHTQSGFCASYFNDSRYDTQLYGSDSTGEEIISYEQIYNASNDTWSKLEKEPATVYDNVPNHTLP